MAGHMGATMLRSTGKAAGVGLGTSSIAGPAIGLSAAAMSAPLLSYLEWHDQATGMLYRSMVTNKETPIDPKIASVIANIVAIPYAAIEMSQINRIVPGADKLGTKVVQNVAGFSVMDNLAKAAAKQTIPTIIGKNFKEYSATWGKEMGEEILQGQIELVSKEYAKNFNNMVRGTEYELNINDVSKMSKEMGKNLLMTAKESAGPLALMTGPRHLMKTKSDIGKNIMIDRSYQKEAIELMRPIPLNLSPEKLKIIENGINNNENPTQTAKKAKVSVKAVKEVKKTITEAQGETINPDGSQSIPNIPIQPEQPSTGNPPIVEPSQNPPIETTAPIVEPSQNPPIETTSPIVEPSQNQPIETTAPIVEPIQNPPSENQNTSFKDKYGVDIDDFVKKDVKGKYFYNKVINGYNDLNAAIREKKIPVNEVLDELDKKSITLNDSNKIDKREKVFSLEDIKPVYISHKTKKTGFDTLKNIASNDDTYPITQGVYVDNGKLVATNRHMLVVLNDNSLDEYNGQVLNLNGNLPYQQAIEGKFPNYNQVIPNIETSENITEDGIDIDELRGFSDGAIKRARNIESQPLTFTIEMGGKLFTCDSKSLKSVLNVLKDNGAKSVKLSIFKYNSALKDKGEDFYNNIKITDEKGNMGLIMGLLPEEDWKWDTWSIFKPYKINAKLSQNPQIETTAPIVEPSQESEIPENVKREGPTDEAKTEKSTPGLKHWVSSDLVKGNKQGKVITVNDLIKHVRNIFHEIVLRPKAYRRMGKAAGFYERGTSFIRSRSDKDISTITHELAHSIHSLKTKYDIWKNNPEFQKELIPLDYIPDRRNKRLSIIEGFAEFVRMWAKDDPDLPNLAPKFLDYFENTFLKENDPDGQWQKLKQLLTEYRNQDVREYYDAGLVRHETRYERMMKSINGFVERAKIHPLAKIQMAYARTISKLHDNARASEVMLKLTLGRSYYQLAYKDRFIELWRMTQGRAGEAARRMIFETQINPLTGKKMGKSLVDVFKSVCKTKEDMIEFEKYLKAKQLYQIYKSTNGNYILPHGQTKDYLIETIDQIEEDRPEFIGAREEYKSFNDNLLMMVKDAGGFSDELYEYLQNHFSAWIPIEHEVIESEYPGGTPGKGTSKSYANINQPVNKLRHGSESPLIPFIDSYAKHVEKMIAFASKVRAVRSLIDITDIPGDMGTEIKKTLSQIVRITDAPTSVKGIKIEVLIEALERHGYEIKTGEDATGLDELLNFYFSDYIPKSEKFGTVMVFKNGKPVYIELNTDLYNLLMASGEGINYAGTNILMKALSQAGKMVRYGATTAKIAFSLYSNLISDTINRVTASDNLLSNPFQTLNGILAELVRKNKSSDLFTKLGIPADMAQKYMASGGAFSTQLGADAKALYDMQNQFKSSVTNHEIVFSCEHPFEALRTLLSFTENSNRISDFKEVYNKVLKQTGNEEEAYIRAVRSSQDITIDFLRHGDWTKFMSVIKAFYNSQAQGLSKTMRNMTELTPTKYGKNKDGRLIVERNRLKAMYFIPKVIAWHFAMNILQRALMPEDKKEEFDGYQGWKKTGFWHFWIKGHHIWVPCKFVQGAIVNGIINLSIPPMNGKRYKEESKEWMDHVWNESFSGLIPFPDVQKFLSGVNIIGSFSDITSNKDAFGIPIEPIYARMNEPDRLKIVNDNTFGITTKATEMIHGLSKKSPMLTFMGDISPVQLQYFLGKNTGGAYWRAGAWIQLIGDLSTGKKITLEKAPITSSIFREDNPLNKRTVRKFYENINDKENPKKKQYSFIQKQVKNFDRIYKADKLKQTPSTTSALKKYQRAYKIKIGLDDKEQFRREVLYNIISKGMEKIGDY
jgi:hypothetical protein